MTQAQLDEADAMIVEFDELVKKDREPAANQ